MPPRWSRRWWWLSLPSSCPGISSQTWTPGSDNFRQRFFYRISTNKQYLLRIFYARKTRKILCKYCSNAYKLINNPSKSHLIVGAFLKQKCISYVCVWWPSLNCSVQVKLRRIMEACLTKIYPPWIYLLTSMNCQINPCFNIYVPNWIYQIILEICYLKNQINLTPEFCFPSSPWPKQSSNLYVPLLPFLPLPFIF